MSYLLDEQPLLVMPKLAVAIGLNEAIFLQQLRYWVKKSHHDYDGHKWVYNTRISWNEQFPFWSDSTLKRTISSLEKQGLVLVGNYNKAKFDKTKWYAINFEKLEQMEWSNRLGQNDPMESVKMTQRTVQNDPMESVKMTQPIPETTTEITTKTTTEKKNNGEPSSQAPAKSRPESEFVIDGIIKYLNLKTGRNFNPETKEYRRYVGARLKAGVTLEQVKYVIDVKCAEWLNNEEMKKNLNPVTLFRPSNFDRYLNQEMPKQKEKTLRDLMKEGQIDLSDML